MKLSATLSAKDFNATLKSYLKKDNPDVRIRIINSYKYPNCYVEAWTNKTLFNNSLRLSVFDAAGFDRSGLRNAEDVAYGNIRSNRIAVPVHTWVRLFENNN